MSKMMILHLPLGCSIFRYAYINIYTYIIIYIYIMCMSPGSTVLGGNPKGSITYIYNIDAYTHACISVSFQRGMCLFAWLTLIVQQDGFHLVTKQHVACQPPRLLVDWAYFPKLDGWFINFQTPVDLLQQRLIDPTMYFFAGYCFTFQDFLGLYSVII